jgi:aminoglycoside phosphotransferase (APT) family kinase protein
MPTPWQRDLARDRERLADWLVARIQGTSDLRLSELRAPQNSGFSNDTLLFDVEYARGTRTHREALVARIQPTGFQVFPDYDMGLQFRTLELLSRTDVPVPRPRWLEARDASVLGAPFYVMDQVRGRVPPDNPPYHVTGWVTEISPEEREALWWSGIECMAGIHRLDWRAVGFGFLDRPERGATALEQQLAYYQDYLRWAAEGREQPTIAAALEWLLARRPTGERTVLSWGDARIGNILFDGTKAVAVLDWEMVGLGAPEMDLAWQIFLDKHHSLGMGQPRLAGFPSYEATARRYQELTGFELRHLHYYEVFAGFRFAVVMLRIAQQCLQYGVMDEATSRAFERNNTVTRLLARLLDLPDPS